MHAIRFASVAALCALPVSAVAAQPPLEESACKAGRERLPPLTDLVRETGVGSFHLLRGGVVRYEADNAAGTFSVDPGSSTVFVRVEVGDDRWCGEATANTRYRLPERRGGRDTATISLIAAPVGGERPRAHAAARARIHALVDHVVLGQRNGSFHAALTDRLERRVTTAADALFAATTAKADRLRDHLECAGADEPGWVENEVLWEAACGRLGWLRARLGGVRGHVVAARWNEAIDAARRFEGLGIGPGGPDDATKNIDWFLLHPSTDETPVVLARHTLALERERDRLFVVPYDDGVLEVRREATRARASVVVTEVPSSQRQVAFQQRRGPSTATDPAAALARFGTILVTAGTPALTELFAAALQRIHETPEHERPSRFQQIEDAVRGDRVFGAAVAREYALARPDDVSPEVRQRAMALRGQQLEELTSEEGGPTEQVLGFLSFASETVSLSWYAEEPERRRELGRRLREVLGEERFRAVLQRLGVQLDDPASPREVTADARYGPLATRMARTYVTGPLVEDHRNDLFICSGARCDREGDDANVRNEIRVTPEPECQVTALLGFSVFGWVGVDGRTRTVWARDRASDDMMAGTAAFTLEERDMPLLPSAVALIALRFRDVVFALGPSIVTGDSDPLRHWQGAFGWRFRDLSRNLWILLTAGVLVEDVPVGRQIEETIQRPIPETGEPTPPSVETEPFPLPTFGLAIVVDLEGIGTAAEGLVEAVTGDD